LHFNPKKLVAGGGDEMSLWISNGVVGLHGGQMRLYVPVVVEDDKPEKASTTGSPGDSKEKAKTALAPHVIFSGHHGKTVVVELPLTRVLTPDDQLKMSRLESPLTGRSKAAGASEEESDEEDEDEVWDPNDSSLSAQNSAMSLLAAENRDVVEECDAESFGPSRRVSHGPAFPGGQSRRASGMPMHLRNRHGSSWVALDEHGTFRMPFLSEDSFVGSISFAFFLYPSYGLAAAVSRRASRAVIGMTFTAPTVKSNQASREGSRRPSHQGSRRPSVGHGARSSLTRSGSFEKGLQTLNTEAMLQAAANRIARLEASAEDSAVKEAPAVVPKATVVKPPEKATKPAAAASGPRKLLLVVDDSDLTRKMLCRIMKAQGYDYEEADDGDVAVEMVRKNMGRTDGRTYAVILMDFIMPVMDGPTATKHIRELGFTAPVLGVTGNGQDFDVAHFVASGANKVFTKPLDVQGFRAYMKAVKDKQAADKQAADERR
jgi:CheY-like chemotaxis protein